jgi:hypothetical protein
VSKTSKRSKTPNTFYSFAPADPDMKMTLITPSEIGAAFGVPGVFWNSESSASLVSSGTRIARLRGVIGEGGGGSAAIPFSGAHSYSIPMPGHINAPSWLATTTARPALSDEARMQFEAVMRRSLFEAMDKIIAAGPAIVLDDYLLLLLETLEELCLEREGIVAPHGASVHYRYVLLTDEILRQRRNLADALLYRVHFPDEVFPTSHPHASAFVLPQHIQRAARMTPVFRDDTHRPIEFALAVEVERYYRGVKAGRPS